MIIEDEYTGSLEGMVIVLPSRPKTKVGVMSGTFRARRVEAIKSQKATVKTGAAVREYRPELMSFLAGEL